MEKLKSDGITKSHFHGAENKNCSAIFLSVLTFTLMSSAEGICYTVQVSGASEYYSYYDLNNYYNYYYYDCRNNYYDDSWGAIYQYNSYRYHLMYREDLWIPEMNETIDGWVLGSTLCSGNGNTVYAYAKSSYPYYFPSGIWWQWNPYTNSYDYTPSISVKCYTPALTAWAITGIVIASLCGLALLIGILACICSRCQKKKLRTQAPRPPPPPPTAVYVTSNDYVTTVGVAEAVPYSPNPTYPSPISPPAYDNSPPPAYTYQK